MQEASVSELSYGASPCIDSLLLLYHMFQSIDFCDMCYETEAFTIADYYFLYVLESRIPEKHDPIIRSA